MQPLKEQGVAIEHDLNAPVRECSFCHQPCALASITCDDAPNTAYCLTHAQLCGGPASRKTVRVRHSGERLHELLGLLQSRLARRQQWLQEAAAALASSPALEAVEALLREASVMQIQDKLCDQLQRLATSGHAWQAKAEDVLSSSSTHSLEHVTELISAGRSLSLQLVSIEPLETALSQARAWQEQADQLLGQGRRNGSWQPDICASREELSATPERPAASLLLLPQAKELRDELRRIRLVGEVERIELQVTRHVLGREEDVV